jgi:small basic protein (TIGR04137 family)
MSMDKGLKPRSSLSRHRNVLTRAERIEKLKEIEKWHEGQAVFGLPKVAHRKVVVKKAKAAPKAAEAAGAGAEGVPAAEGAEAGAKPAAKGAAKTPAAKAPEAKPAKK